VSLGDPVHAPLVVSSCGRKQRDDERGWRSYLTTDEEEPAEAVVARAGWTFVKTVEDWGGWKHEYAVEAKYADDPDFRRLAELIEAEGYKAKFRGDSLHVPRVDDYLDETMLWLTLPSAAKSWDSTGTARDAYLRPRRHARPAQPCGFA
jgi:hypothetical protein